MNPSLWSRFLNYTQIRPEYSRKPLGFTWRSSKVFIAGSVGAGLFTDLFLYGLIVPVLPFMLVDHVGLPQDQVQGHVSSLLAAYAGASVVTSPIAGIITDKFSSRRAPFLLGVSFLTMATALLVLARSITLLVVARACQGVSACFVWSTGMALLFETVGPEHLGKYIGAIFGFISIGTLLAPMLGGILYEKGGLTSVFALAFAILAIDFFCRLVIIEARDAEQYNKNNGQESVPASAQASGEEQITAENAGADETTRLLSDATTASEEDPYKLSSNLPGICRLIPILPCLASPRLIAALTIAFVQAILIGSIDATVPLTSEEYFGFTSLQAGLMFLPIGIANLIFGPFLGWCIDKLGTKAISVSVYLYLVPVLACFQFVSPGGRREIIIYEVLLALVGIGMAGMGAPSIIEASKVVAKYHMSNLEFFGTNGPYAQLYSLNFFFYSLGLAVGPELAGQLRQRLGYGTMNIVLAVICAVTALVCFRFIGEGRKAK